MHKQSGQFCINGKQQKDSVRLVEAYIAVESMTEWIVFAFIILALSTPSIFKAVTVSLPSDNWFRNHLFGKDVYHALNIMAPLLASLLSALVLPVVVRIYAQKTGLRLSLLMMFSRMVRICVLNMFLGVQKS